MPLCVVKIFLRNSIHGNKLLSKNPNLSKQKELYKKKYEEKNRILFCSPQHKHIHVFLECFL